MRHFITGLEYSSHELCELITQSLSLKHKDPEPILSRQCVALLFEKPSLRTRVSFTVAIHQLGGTAIELVSSARKAENPEDTIRVLQGMVQALMLRTYEHSILERMQSFSKIPIINGLSDTHHPCQALADIMTLKEHFQQTRGLNLTWLGDGNNVLNSLLLLAPVFGINVIYSCPPGYGPNSLIVRQASQLAQKHNCSVEAVGNPKIAAAKADALYTDVWTSMGFEEEARERKRALNPYQLNATLYSYAKSHTAIMHCMPINRDEEITHDMIDHPNSLIFSQSENRLHAQKALLVDLFQRRYV